MEEGLMFDSQALETVIGLVVMFFIVALGASSLVEVWSRVLQKRAKDLERALGAMLAGQDNSESALAALNTLKGTSIYESALAATGKTLFRRRPRAPSYLSAKAFADAVTEMLVDEQGQLKAIDQLPQGLKKRLRTIVQEARGDLLGIKAGLEGWFDETMGRLEGSYKRWATLWVVLAGIVIAVSANASTFHTAKRLWREPATRQAVANAANGLTDAAKPTDLTSVASTTAKLKDLGLPIGWDQETKDVWKKLRHPLNVTGSEYSSLAGFIGGWILTALLVMLGAPFWFDLLTRLVSLRSTGRKPPTARNDPSSATAVQAEALTRSPAASLRRQATSVADWEEGLSTALGAKPRPANS
jgi:hypothetical protein